MRKMTPRFLGLCLLTVTPLWAQPTTRPATDSSAAGLELQAIQIAPQCVASTVGLLCSIQQDDTVTLASGSGVIVSPDGLILTAGHVIPRPGGTIIIRLTDGRILDGVAIGKDDASDTGLARIIEPTPPGGWPWSAMAQAESGKWGEWVLATGNPGSIVMDRDPPLRLGRISFRNADLINTNCAVEPGDSGGPLFDLLGRVVGINSKIVSKPDTVPSQECFSIHVSIGTFLKQWKDLLADRNARPDGNHEGLGTPLKTDPVPGDGAGVAVRDRVRSNAPATQPEEADATDRVGHEKPPATAPVKASDRPAARVGVPSVFRAKVGALLKENLLRQFPDAVISDALLDRMMDRSEYDDATGRLKTAGNAQDLRDMGVEPQGTQNSQRGEITADRSWVKAGKTSLQTLSLFVPAMNAAGDCVVEIREGAKAVLLGTIIGSDGWMITKASDLPAHPTVVLPSGQNLTPRIVGIDDSTDLALLKVATTGLTPVTFAETAPLGAWVGAPAANPNQIAIGVVSVPARPIRETFVRLEGQQKWGLGVKFEHPACVISEITPGLPAEAAGMRVNDEIFLLNGKPATTSEALEAAIKTTKPGDQLDIRVRRGGNELEFNIVTGQTAAVTKTANDIGLWEDVAGGKLSQRRTNFPLAIQTDAAIMADQCGGPLINLRGQAVGLVIARYDRCCTFALPSRLVKSTVEKLKQSK